MSTCGKQRAVNDTHHDSSTRKVYRYDSNEFEFEFVNIFIGLKCKHDQVTPFKRANVYINNQVSNIQKKTCTLRTRAGG